MLKKLLLVFFVICSVALSAQVAMTGKVYDEYLEPFPSALIIFGDQRVSSDIEGNFTIKNITNFPFKIQVNALGYQSEEIEVLTADQELNIILKENTTLDEVVISASRSPERIIESPVTIERMGITDIKRNTSISFYDGLTNLKGIESREASYGFKSINARGFSTFDNTRFVQLADGVETSIPAFNFSAGNVVGLSDLDVKNVEILPGASSALYGANAFNGILLMRSKNPFDYDGISTYFKTGFMTQKEAGTNPFYDVGIRMAYKFSNYFAAKVNLTAYKAEEWHANDLRNTTGIGGVIKKGDRKDSTDYDGVNVYGDDFSVSLKQIAEGGNLPAALIATLNDDKISRTGYAENELYDYDAFGVKFDGSLHFRPMGNDKLEIILNSRLSKGNTLYQGANRFVQNYYVEQHKLEVLGKNFFVRGYFTGNDTGDKTHDLRFAALGINDKFKSNEQWFGDYLTAYLTNGRDHDEARVSADLGRFKPGTPQFKQALDEVIAKPLSQGGAGITDKTKFYHAEGNYNFRDLINWGEIQVGASYRKFITNSSGSLFTDKDSPVEFDMYGVYSQLQKKFLDDRLKFTGSVRYDKLKNFEGNFSPRIALNYSVRKNKILRASFQTGFRNPSTIEQFFGLRSGPNSYILGTSSENIDRFSAVVRNNNGSTNTITGKDVFAKSFVLSSGGVPVSIKPDNVKAEKVSSYEVGYRSIVDLNDTDVLELDVSAYYNQYDNFAAIKNVFVPNYGAVVNGVPDGAALTAFSNGDVTSFSLNTNTVANIDSYGVGIGINTKVFKSYNLGVNYTLSKLVFNQKEDPSFEPGFNTPEHQVKLMFGNANLFKNFGFNINARWQNEFLWQSSFLDANIDSRTVLDAQMNYRMPSLKSTIKIGGTNLTRKEYVVAPGSGLIGTMYYVSWTINN